MRVLFIYPSIDCPPGINHGLADISGVLKARGHRVDLLHVNEKLWPIPTAAEVVDQVRRERPDIIGFSVMSQQWAWSVTISQAIRAEFPEIPQAVGGVHCTMVPDEVNDAGHFEWAFVGEADYSFSDLVDRIARGDDVTKIPGTRMPARNPGAYLPATYVGPRSNALDPYPDLEKLPPKDYDLFDIDHITRVKDGWLGMITSRGCPYKCTYCFNKEIVDLYQAEGAAKSAREYLRHYPAETIIKEIKELKAAHPHINTLIFDDDLFTLDKPFVLSFTELYKNSGIDLPYVVNAHVQQFNDDLAGALHDSGCMICKFGLESGSDSLRRDVLWRFMPNWKIEEAFHYAHNYDIHTSAFVMFGLPHESRAQIQETIDLCARIKMGRFRWAIFFPFPGTAGYRIAKEANLIDFEKMGQLGNYFDGSCLHFGDEHDLYISKLGKLFSVFVNAATDWPCAPLYREFAEEVEAMDRATWIARAPEMVARERALSDQLMAEDILHYTIRFAHVMGVRSDFVKWDRERLAAQETYGAPIKYTLD